MTDKGVATTEEGSEQQHQVERSSHAIYGLIIITAALVADREFARDALESLAALWGAGMILVLAHVYSALVAEVGEKGRWLNHAERHVLIVDNIPVLAALVVPTVLLLLAAADVIGLGLAIDASIAIAIASLFGVGFYQSRQQGASIGVQISVGALGAVIGAVIILLEAFGE